MSDTHSNCPSQKNRASSEAVDCPETRKGHDDVDGVDDDLQDEGVGQAFDIVREERGAVVDDKVDTNQLLKGLQYDSGDGPFTGSALEALEIRSRADGLLILPVALQLFHLGEEVWIFRAQAAEENQGLESLGVFAFFDKEARSLGEEDEAASLFAVRYTVGL